MDGLAALGRMSVSLVAVLGLLFLVTRWLRRSKGAAAASGDIVVLSRQAVGHKAGVAVVRVGQQAVVVGVTEHQVTLLCEMPVASIAPQPVETRDVVEIPVQARARPVPPPLAAGGAAALPLGGTGEVGDLERQLRSSDPAAASGALAGSALSPSTWTKAVDVLRERSTRR